MWRLLLGRAPSTTTTMSRRMAVRRLPLQKLAANDVAAAATSFTSSSLEQKDSSSLLLSQQQRFLSSSATRRPPQTSYPPRIQSWLDRKSPVELSTQGPAKSREALLIHRDKLLDEITKDDPLWLEQVVKEIRNDVLVGSMTEPVRNLCHTLMRWLRTQGFMAQIVEDLLLRLIEEEDSGGRIHGANAVIFSIAIDAWAKQSSIPDAPHRAEALLQLMQDRHKKNPSQRPRPRAYHVSHVLVAWSNSSLSHAPQRAEQLLHWMEDEGNKFPPTVHAYTSVIHAYSRHGKAQDSERILRSMEARLKDDPDNAIRPNVKTYTSVISAWAHADQGQRGAHMAEAARQRLNELYATTQDDDLKPNVKMLSALMHAWAKSDSKEQGEKAEAIWNEIVDLHSGLSKEERKHPSNQIGIIPYTIRMEAWGKSRHPEKAEEILNEMLEKVERGDKDAVAPSQVSWTTVAHGWGRKGKVKRVEDILKRMHDQYCRGLSSAKRDVVIYNALLLAWRKSKDPLAANKAQRLLDWMEEQADNGMEELRPNDISYDLVITAWRTSRQTDRSGKMALALLDRMEKYLETHRVSNKSSIPSAYTMTLMSVARGGKDDTHLEVLRLLRRIESIHQSGSMGRILTNHCYHIVIASCAWAPTRDGEQLSEDILRRMEASTHRDFRPKRRSYEATIVAWARSFKEEAPARAHAILKTLEELAKEKPDSPYEPSNSIYNYVLAACIASSSPEAEDIAREVVKKMAEKRRNGDETMRPSTGTFKLLYGNKFDQRDSMSAGPIEEMISQMESSTTGTESVDEKFLFACYWYALCVWGWSIDPDAVPHAEQLWEQMNDSSHVSPDLECCNSLLRAYTNDSDRKQPDKSLPQKADELLRKMEREFSMGNNDWRPDTTSYDCATEIWSKSKLAGAPERAMNLLERMDTIYKRFGSDDVKPNVNTYGWVLLACALTPARDDATKLHHFNIAVRAFNHLRDSEYCEPNRSLYNRLLMCAIYLAPDRQTRVKMTRHIFLLCCRTGHVDKRIFKHFWKVAPKEERRHLLGRDDDEVKVSDLPPEWTVNAEKDSSKVLYR